jgi:hypothetical protein
VQIKTRDFGTELHDTRDDIKIQGSGLNIALAIGRRDIGWRDTPGRNGFRNTYPILRNLSFKPRRHLPEGNQAHLFVRRGVLTPCKRRQEESKKEQGLFHGWKILRVLMGVNCKRKKGLSIPRPA